MIYKNVLFTACLGSTSNMSHVENRCPQPRFYLIDNNFVARAVEADFKNVKDDKSNVLEVWTNANFGAWYLPKKKSPPTEDFNFADKKASAHEVIRVQLLEGASLSCLGRLSYDSTT